MINNYRFLIFTNYRIPRECLLNKTGDVNEDGVYVTSFRDPKKKLGASLGNLSAGRVNIPHIAYVYLSKALTIAIRYAGVRKQFGPENGEELPIIEYEVHVSVQFSNIFVCKEKLPIRAQWNLFKIF